MTDPAGYDPEFLAVTVPAPGSGARPVRLDYTHFSVGLDPARRLAAWTAVNIDGAALVDVARGGDDWFLDPRLPEEQQTGPEVYARNDLDRGHLVRRRDPVWGEAAERANADTFCYTNAAPQAAGFNQSKELWLGLEDHLLTTTDAADVRVSVLTGCVFAEDDPGYRGIRIPRRFYKVAAWVEAGALLSVGYLLDQSRQLEDVELGRAGEPLLGPYRTFQVPVGDLAALTGLDLGPLPAADVAPAAGLRPGVPWRRLHSTADIVGIG
ncbi:DNA/RNA non-specific endonuclease [Desertihabitans brevis]|uniref:DNA/RNA non-specific endonuclease n=1 Tax=Desertihabitans brevis TaxID=2268447 RepID=A0A367YQF6_9ACTN|nr:DNA/RNA non-specific endonuclease [Desertihabitans brevis]RCK67977.1 DNA/RNA non-specific endonuclease [Desertihabitans brevis]